MTEINTVTTRRTRSPYNVLHHRKARKICASFLPGDVLEFRESGRRGRWSIPIDAVFRIAVKIKAEADRRARAEARSSARRT